MAQSNITLGPDISPLSVPVEPIDANILHVEIGAPGRYKVVMAQEAIFMNTGMGEDTDACIALAGCSQGIAVVNGRLYALP